MRIPRCCTLVAAGVFALSSPAWAEEPAPSTSKSAGDMTYKIPGFNKLIKAKKAASDEDALRTRVQQLEEQLKDLKEQSAESNSAAAATSTAAADAMTPPKQDEPSDVAVYGTSLTVNGAVDGDATAYGGNVRVKSGARVKGDVRALGGNVWVEPGAEISGEAVAVGGTVVVEDGGSVAGNRLSLNGSQGSGGPLSTLYSRTIFLLSFLGAGALMVGLFPARVNRVASSATAKPLRATAAGAAAVPIVLAVAALLVVPVVTMPISFALIAMLGFAWLLGFVGLAQAFGDRLPLEEPTGRWVALGVGAIGFAVLTLVGWPGWILLSLVSVIGIGAALNSRFGAPATY